MKQHSKFSASGADRWWSCPGSVALSEGLPDTSSPWAIEGTQAHSVLENMLKKTLNYQAYLSTTLLAMPGEMIMHASKAASFILGIHDKAPNSEVLVETRVSLAHIHPEAFGTLDAAVVDVFGTLHIIDYKYGAGHAVSPRENLQLIFYALGVAHAYNYNFGTVRLTIIQPRVKGYDGPAWWDLSLPSLFTYRDKFIAAIENVLAHPTDYKEGDWCRWCKAVKICPLKREQKQEKAMLAFSNHKGKTLAQLCKE